MPLLSLVRKIVKQGQAPTPAPPTSSRAGTAEARSPVEESQPAYPENTWWVPSEGVPLINPPKPELTSEEIEDQGLYRFIQRLLEDPRIELPQIPEVARRALAMLRDPNVDFKRLAEVVHEDQVLSAEALRVANSPAFRGASRIKRIDFAFARLGRRNVYDLMLKSAIKRVITLECPQYRAIAQELWRCALASGVIGRELGRLYGLPEDDVFLSGLFHDIGTVAILKILDDQYVASEKFVPRDVFDVISNEWHELIGFRLATAWDLPEPIPDIIGEHHDEPAPTDPLMLHKLLVQVSDVACSLLRFKAYVPFDFFHVRCVRTLGLEDDRATREVLASLPDQITSGRQGF